MKRLIPIFGLFLITTLLGCTSKEEREREKRCSTSIFEPLEVKVGRNPSDPPVIYETYNDFENRTTWQYFFYSSNALPYLKRDRSCNNKQFLYKKSATLHITCKKYNNPQNTVSNFYSGGSYELTFSPPANLKNSPEGKYLDIKWDEMMPKKIRVNSDGEIFYPNDLIKKFGKHSKLQIRYRGNTMGEQIAVFETDKDQFVSEILKKCS